MLTILLHSSKTMRHPDASEGAYQQPAFQSQAVELAAYISSLSATRIASTMKISPKKADEVKQLYAQWKDKPTRSLAAIDAFRGDIYSGLQAKGFTPTDRDYANEHLFILSGLYGGLKALDSIQPYRLEMGYRLPKKAYRSLYTYWGDAMARVLASTTILINLSAVEYTKALLPYLPDTLVITPKFMTINHTSGEPQFVVVHAKIARGAFAHWLVKERVKDICEFIKFGELGYVYNASLSTEAQPVFTCETFEGLGLSVRLR